MPANKYAPDTIPGLGKWMQRYPDKFSDPNRWKENLALIKALRGGFWMPDNQFLVSVVDEAHALINPEHSDARTQSGWPNPLGPQAYHIIRASTVSIFLLDSEQSFRERESTTTDEIQNWARELGAKIAPLISLAGGQFRCAGSREYVEWVETVLRDENPEKCPRLVRSWSEHSVPPDREPFLKISEAPPQTTAVPVVPRRLEFRVFDSPFEMEAALRAKVEGGATARLVAPFARKWVTKDVARPHDLPPPMQDFHIRCRFQGQDAIWHRPWNVIPRGNNYASFIQAAPGSRMSHDPLAEVGCTYAVRGFDFDYIGLLWLSDMKWQGGRWRVFPKQVHETGVTRVLGRARHEQDPDGPNHRALLRRVQQAYRILLTRALKGVYVWFEDDETRRHVEACLRG